MNTDPGLLCWALYTLTAILNCLESRLKLMCIDRTKSNKRIHPRKLAPKRKYQKLDKLKLNGKKYFGKGCVIREK